MSSRSRKPDGRAGDGLPVARELLELVDLLVEDLVDRPEVAGRLAVGDVEQLPLGVLDQLVRLPAALGDAHLDRLRHAEQPSQRGLVLDELRVVARVADGRHDRGQLVHVRLAAGPLQLAALLELGADRERVDRLVLVVERQDRAVDRAVRVAVEVVGAQPHLDQHGRDRARRDEHRAQHRFLGLEVLRRDHAASAGLLRRYRQGDGGAEPSSVTWPPRPSS